MEIDNVAILLATFNGGKYLGEQIESIINQSYKKWHLFIHDDGSTDNTLNIVKYYCQEDNRIMIFDDENLHLGPFKGYMKMLSEITAPLYMFCDQDDIWSNTKIEDSIDSYKLCLKDNPNSAIIVHTDVTVVDEKLNILALSHWRDTNIVPNKLKSYHYLALCDYVQGNTMLLNNEAKALSLPAPDYVDLHHDWWIATRVIRNGGIIETLDKTTVLYRQHDDNVCGFRYGKQNRIINRLFHIKEVFISLLSNYKMVKRDGFGGFGLYLWVKFKLILHMHLKSNY